MQLYLTQHGKAVEKTVDPDRPLSAQGRHEVTAVAHYLKQANTRVYEILHSGKTRAAQSAEIFAEILSVSRVKQVDCIKPNDAVEPMADLFANINENTMLVSHIPFLPRLLHLLLTGETEAEPAALPGNIVCLEQSEDQQWLLSGTTSYDNFSPGNDTN